MKAFLTSLMSISLLGALLFPGTSLAGDHGSHPPMGPPLSVVCAAKPVDEQFLCLHPGYAALLVSMTGLSIPFAGDGSGVCAGYYDGFHAGCKPPPSPIMP